jgi:hypothetical protein
MGTTLRAWFDRFTKQTGERPTHIVFGESPRYAASGEWPIAHPKVVIEFDHLHDLILDHEFDDDYGGNESPDLCAWSPSWVIFSDNYDGAEDLCWVPRAPRDHDPIRPGGG